MIPVHHDKRKKNIVMVHQYNITGNDLKNGIYPEEISIYKFLKKKNSIQCFSSTRSNRVFPYPFTGNRDFK